MTYKIKTEKKIDPDPENYLHTIKIRHMQNYIASTCN